MLLIVEDDRDTMDVMCIVARDQGVAYERASTVEGALSKLRKVSPSIMIVDFMLGGENAGPVITLCQSLHPDCKIVVFSALHQAKLDHIAEQFVLKTVIRKPFDLEDLETVLRSG